jgi:hypothetical protein
MRRKPLLQFMTVCLALAIAGHVITYLFLFVFESKTGIRPEDSIKIELTKAVHKDCITPESI